MDIPPRLNTDGVLEPHPRARHPERLPDTFRSLDPLIQQQDYLSNIALGLARATDGLARLLSVNGEALTACRAAWQQETHAHQRVTDRAATMAQHAIEQAASSFESVIVGKDGAVAKSAGFTNLGATTERPTAASRTKPAAKPASKPKAPAKAVVLDPDGHPVTNR